MIEREIILHLEDPNVRVRIPVSQFDTMWRFVFTILYKGQPWEIPTGAAAILSGLKPDGNVFAFEGTVAGNRITMDCDVQMTAAAGSAVCEMSILSGGKTVGTANFMLDVEAAPKSPDDVSSESVLPAYAKLLQAAADLTPGGQYGGPALDDTLTVSGAAADAAAVGERFDQLDIVTPGQLNAALAGKADVNALAGKADVNSVHNNPSGGLAGQFLVKSSAADYDVAWVTVPDASGVSF